ncbi:MAG TPA: basic amino acid/polyamine antiporter [Candidatus Nanoperiomorbaceae bacterium]|nr:basic amino acid/polyamine antiporter [Candidatus Nanoperiomorbaceae bacterium]HMR85889.1 basic amino acid/polyamine antiporter [Candidatus Nanoperiomorbaceae bacterium]HMU11738.1 basic amino acid/polyamine antiporter [Candidatus Nanoperiomorbaceae bacterium]
MASESIGVEHAPHLKKGKSAQLGLFSLTSLVVGSIIGSGIFNLISAMTGAGASAAGILIAWAVMGVGLLFLVLCFINLNKKRPDLDAGVYSYARAGFGKFMGFNSTWGYWISAWIGNVAYATAIFSSLNYFIKNVFITADGDVTGWTIVGATVLIWAVMFAVARGVQSAAIMNVVATVGKIVPIVIFIIVVAVAFKLKIWEANLWGNAMKDGVIQWKDLFAQVSGAMLAMVFAFIGIEGASNMSAEARNKKEVGKATILGFISVVVLYMLITVLSLGVMSADNITNLNTNNATAMAQILESVVGSWGGALVSIGMIISVLGVWIAWTLFAIEIPYEAAKRKTLPAVFAKTNKHGAPIVALVVTSICIQIFVLAALWSSQPYNLMFTLCSSMILVPYLLVAGYQLKLSLTEKARSVWQIIVGLVATLFAIWLVYAGGLSYALVMTILYMFGIAIYVWTQRENKEKVFANVGEWIVAAIIVVIGFYALWWLIFGGGWGALMA